MALIQTFPQRPTPSCVIALRNAGLAAFVCLSLVAGAAGAVERSGSGSRAQNYVVEVPVVSAKPIEVTRRVERPVKTCERVAQSSRSHSESRTYTGYERSPRHTERRGVGAQILGGLIGGAIGSQFGGGDGRKALTIAGALIGSSIARGGRHRSREDDHYDDYVDRAYVDRDNAEDDYFEPRTSRHDRSRDYQPEYQCHTTTRSREVTEITGYDVTYRYNNTLFKRRMDHNPGDTLELRVQAVPDVAPTVAES